jgi:hypothetical protein
MPASVGEVVFPFFSEGVDKTLYPFVNLFGVAKRCLSVFVADPPGSIGEQVECENGHDATSQFMLGILHVSLNCKESFFYYAILVSRTMGARAENLIVTSRRRE